MHWLILLATVLPVAAMMAVVALGYCMLKKMPIAWQTDTGIHFVKECKNDHPECKNDQLEFDHDNPEHMELTANYTASSTQFQGDDSTCEDSYEEPVDDRPRSSMTIGMETLRVVGLSVVQDLLLSLVQKHLEANAMRSHDDLESEVMTSNQTDLESAVMTSGHDDLKQNVVTSGHDDLELKVVTSGHDDLEQKVVTSEHDDLESKDVTFGRDDLESVCMTSRQDEIEIKDVTSNHKDNVVTSFHDDMKPDVVTSGHGTNSDGSCLEHETDAVNCDPSHQIPGCDREETLADGKGKTDGETTYDYQRDQQTLDKLSSLSSIAENDGVEEEEENVANLINVLFVNDSVRRESFLSTLLAVRCTGKVQLLIDAIFRAFRLHNCVLRHWGKEQEAIEEGNDSRNVIYKINFLWNSIKFSCITTTTHGMGFIEATGALVDPKQEEERNPNWSECVAFRLANDMLRNKFTNMMPDSSSACVQSTHRSGYS